MFGGAYYFGVYESFKNAKYPVRQDGSRDQMSFGYIMLFGGLSGVAFWVLGYPWDVIKTKMQSDSFDNLQSLRQTAKSIYSARGIKGFYSGFVPCLLRCMPANGAVFAGFELGMMLMKDL